MLPSVHFFVTLFQTGKEKGGKLYSLRGFVCGFGGWESRPGGSGLCLLSAGMAYATI